MVVMVPAHKFNAVAAFPYNFDGLIKIEMIIFFLFYHMLTNKLWFYKNDGNIKCVLNFDEMNIYTPGWSSCGSKTRL